MRLRLFILSAALFVSRAAAGQGPDELIKAGHWKRAKSLIETAYAQNPKNARALVWMAQVKRAWGDPESAQKFVDQALAIDANSFEAHFELTQILADELEKTSFFKQMSGAGKLRHEIETSVQLKPTDVDAHWGMMQYYLQAPGVAGGSKSKARDQVAAISAISPSWGYLAEAAYEQHEHETGNLEELYRKARDADPKNYNAVFSYCNLMLNQKKWEAGEKCSFDLVKIDPGRGAGYSLLAFAYASEKKWNELDAVLVDAAKSVPDDLAPYFHAGRILAESGADNPRGERYLRRYLEQPPEPNAPKLSRAWWRLGQVLEKENRKSDALAAYQKAIEMEPSLQAAKDDAKRLQ